MASTAPDDPAPTTERAELSPPLIVARSAASGLLLALPAALANGWLAAQDPKPAGALFATYVVVLAGFALAGFVAGLDAPERPDRFGMLAGLGTFLPVEAVAILSRLDRGDPVSAGGIIVVAFLAALFGWLGARPGAARRAARDAKQQGD